MGYDRGDSFPFDFEPNGTPSGSKSKGKLSLRLYPIQCERNWKCSFLGVGLDQICLTRTSFLLRYLCGTLARFLSDVFIQIVNKNVCSGICISMFIVYVYYYCLSNYLFIIYCYLFIYYLSII